MLPQLVLPIRLHHRLHPISTRHRCSAISLASAHDRADTRLHGPRTLVIGSRRQHSGRQRCCQEPGLSGSLSAIRVLRRPELLVLHLIADRIQCKLHPHLKRMAALEAQYGYSVEWLCS